MIEPIILQPYERAQETNSENVPPEIDQEQKRAIFEELEKPKKKHVKANAERQEKFEKMAGEKKGKEIFTQEEESENTNEGDELVKAKASARRRALMQQAPLEEIVQAISKQYPSMKEKSLEIASQAIEWAEKHKPGTIVLSNGIPKKITDIAELDTRFAQLEAPAQPCVTINKLDAQPISTNDFNKRLSGDVVITGVTEKGQPKYTAASAFWSGNANKCIYNNIVFTNKPVSENTYNLFTGFGVKANEGKCDKILNHIKEVICADDAKNYEALLNLLAWQVQNVGRPSRIIVSLKSKAQQAGKGLFLGEMLAPIWGNAGFKTGDIGQILTRFNDTLRGKGFIFLDEALFAGDLQAADAMKSLATATSHGIEAKGLPTVQFPIALNFFLSTNHDDAAHLEEADLRYWILEVSAHRVKDTEYFAAILDEMNEGGKEAFLHVLLNRDVSHFVPARDVPLDNVFKDNMIRNSINPYDARKWLEACCEAEMILGFKPIDKELTECPWEPWQQGQEYINGIFYTAYDEWQKTVRSPIAPRPTAKNNLGKLLTDAGFIQRSESGRRRTLPDPNECLKIVNAMIEKACK